MLWGFQYNRQGSSQNINVPILCILFEYTHHGHLLLIIIPQNLVHLGKFKTSMSYMTCKRRDIVPICGLDPHSRVPADYTISKIRISLQHKHLTHFFSPNKAQFSPTISGPSYLKAAITSQLFYNVTPCFVTDIISYSISGIYSHMAITRNFKLQYLRKSKKRKFCSTNKCLDRLFNSKILIHTKWLFHLRSHEYHSQWEHNKISKFLFEQFIIQYSMKFQYHKVAPVCLTIISNNDG